MDVRHFHRSLFESARRLIPHRAGVVCAVSGGADSVGVSPEAVVAPGDRINVRVIRVDPDRKRIGLSLKRADAAYDALGDDGAVLDEVDDDAWASITSGAGDSKASAADATPSDGAPAVDEPAETEPDDAAPVTDEPAETEPAEADAG